MKKILITTLIASLIFISCSNDDDNTNEPITIEKNYFPLNQGNEWNYSTTEYGNQTSKIEGTETINGLQFSKLINSLPVFGVEGNSSIRQEGNKYFGNSSLTFPQISVDYQNQMFFDGDATAGVVLNSIVDEIVQEPIPVSEGLFNGTVTPTIGYNVSISFVNAFDNLMLNGENFEDVIEIRWVFKISSVLNVRDNIGIINLNHPLIEEQEAGTLIQYYVNDIGVVRSETNFNLSAITFNTNINIGGINFDISQYIEPIIIAFSMGDSNNTSVLTSYTIN
jgi:hypothetical protein